MAENIVDQKINSMKSASQEKEYKEFAEKLGLEYVDLKNYPISSEVLGIVSLADAEKYKIICYLRAGNKVKIAAVDPENKDLTSFFANFKKEKGLEVVLGVTTPENYDNTLKLYDLVKPEQRKESDIIDITEEEKANFEKNIQSLRDVKENLKKVSTSYLLDLIFTGAIKTGASDIHIEPDEKEVIIRYRIDGVLHPIISIDPETAHHINSRIKLLSKMKIDTNKLPQDAKLFITSGKRKIDMRVSTLPEAYGESVVIRIFDKEAAMLRLEDLGLSKEQMKKIEASYKKPHGLVLVTGPTGSGKTTTLYGIIDKINKPGVKIITLEDPVEYDLPGVVQSQIDVEKNYTFATGLRAILRQDPDIVLIGEVRDPETGEMATQASLTGHLVMSTLHTNDAPSALHRLIDIGIRPFLIVDAINLIMAQRLVRKICDSCKEEYKPDKIVVEEIKKVLGEKIKVDKLYRGKGCVKCHNSGFRGRLGLFEMLELSEELKKLTLGAGTLDDIKKAAESAGMETLEEDGLKKVVRGETTPEEVWRVVKD